MTAKKGDDGLRRTTAIALIALSAAIAATPAQARGFSTRVLSDAHVGKTKVELKAQAAFSERIVVSLTSRHGRWMIAPRHASCWDHVPWSKLCNRARVKLRNHRWLHHVASKRLDAIELRELLRSTSSYLGAVAYVERYFGPQSFLRNCPDGEGGYDKWRPNTSGSGAGGWLQFMSGTFYGIIDQAIAAAQEQGMRVPAGTRDWYSPLGQALAGRQMIENGRRGEWTGPNC